MRGKESNGQKTTFQKELEVLARKKIVLLVLAGCLLFCVPVFGLQYLSLRLSAERHLDFLQNAFNTEYRAANDFLQAQESGGAFLDRIENSSPPREVRYALSQYNAQAQVQMELVLLDAKEKVVYEDIIRRGIRSTVPWEQHGCIVAGEARNGEEGRALIERLEPDIVITDINMPVCSGLEMIAQTKCQYDYVTIILTGYSEFEYAKEAIRNGVSDYVLKPLNTEEMGEALDRAVLECRNIRIVRSKSAEAQEKTPMLLPQGETAGRDAVVDRLLEYIAQNYAHKLTLSDMAETLHYSDRYLSQKFQKVLGTTVIEYLNRYRLQKALQMLQNGTPLSTVGWDCGIGDYKYFSHVFRKYLGCSPREYLARLKA